MSNSERTGNFVARWLTKGIGMGVPAVIKRGNFRGGCNGRRLTNNPGISNRRPPGSYVGVR